ncbi:MAG: hypothetical protein NT157_05825 [Candidatus Micrarchaeota archaeon]|nr:hypothetical protein [Candidatus Micrarchaeota archaeon]
MAAKAAELLHGSKAAKPEGAIRQGQARSITEGLQTTAVPRIYKMLDEIVRERDMFKHRGENVRLADIRVDMRRLKRFCDSDEQKLELLKFALTKDSDGVGHMRHITLDVAGIVWDKGTHPGDMRPCMKTLGVYNTLRDVASVLHVAAAAVPGQFENRVSDGHDGSRAYDEVAKSIRERHGEKWAWVPTDIRESIAEKAALKMLDSG